MKEIKELIKEPLENLDLRVDEIEFIKGKPNQLNIILDSDKIINVEKIVEATKVISPLIDKCDFTNEQYVLDVSSKEKGVIKNE